MTDAATLSWEAAASAAFNEVPDCGDCNGAEDAIEDAEYWLNEAKQSADSHAQLEAFGYIADDALQVLTSATVGREEIINSVLTTIAQKQHDYGHDNILWAGLDGVIVRMHDKIARIKNLVSRGKDPANESLKDSWLDVCGYSIIAIMLLQGTFERRLWHDILADHNTATPLPENTFLTSTEDIDALALDFDTDQQLLQEFGKLLRVGVTKFGWPENTQLTVVTPSKVEEA